MTDSSDAEPVAHANEASNEASRTPAERREHALHVAAALRETLRGDEPPGDAGLRLEYQPIICLDTGLIDSAEALLRWRHAELGPLRPDLFVPIAEDAGLAVELGSWVLRAALHQLREWQDAGLGGFPVAINVSAAQFAHHDFATEVIDALAAAGIEPGRLKIELTETTIVRSLARVREQLERLRAHGVESALDDYGTGYSNLNYLSELPTQYVKIDRSFIAALSGDARNTSDIIVRSVVDVVHSLAREVIAEGVETLAQVAVLRSFGCDYVQGWVYGRAMPADTFAELMRGQSADAPVYREGGEIRG